MVTQFMTHQNLNIQDKLSNNKNQFGFLLLYHSSHFKLRDGDPGTKGVYILLSTVDLLEIPGKLEILGSEDLSIMKFTIYVSVPVLFKG